MGSYLLNCDKETAQHTWKSWSETQSSLRGRQKVRSIRHQIIVLCIIFCVMFLLTLVFSWAPTPQADFRTFWLQWLADRSANELANPTWLILFVFITIFSLNNLRNNIAYEIVEMKSENDMIFFSFQLKPALLTRAIFLVTLLVNLAIFEKIILTLPDLGRQMVLNELAPAGGFTSVGGYPDASPFFLILLTCASSLSPLLLLGWGGHILRQNENAFQHFLGDYYNNQVAYIDCFPLAPPRDWLLFPKDTFIIQGGTIALFFVQFLRWLSPSQIVPAFLPYLIIGGVAVILVITREYVYRRIKKAHDIYAYWKIEMAQLAGRVSYFFLFPLFFYLIISLLTLVSFQIPFQPIATPPYYPDISPDFLNYTVDTFIGRLNPFHYMYLHFAFDGGLILTLVLLVCSLLQWRNFTDFHTLQNHYHNRKHIKRDISSISLLRLANTVILIYGLLFFIIGTLSIVVICLGILWFCNGHISWLSSRLMLPFVYFQNAFQDVWGDAAGNRISHLFFLVIFAPSLLYLGMQLYSQIKACWQLLPLTFLHKSNNCNLQNMVDDLCHDLSTSSYNAINSPVVRVESTLPTTALTKPLFPTAHFCILYISPLILDLTPEKQRLILAHELGHAIKHVKKLWWLQLCSSFSIVGPGYLSLLLDDKKMEMEADIFAVEATKDLDGFVALLPDLEDSEGSITANQKFTGGKIRRPRAWILSALFTNVPRIYQIRDFYHLYFDTSLWGYHHPSVGARQNNLQHQFGSLEQKHTQHIRQIDADRILPSVSTPDLRNSSARKWLLMAVNMLLIATCLVLLVSNAMIAQITTANGQASATAQMFAWQTADAQSATATSNVQLATATASAIANANSYSPDFETLLSTDLLNSPSNSSWQDESSASYGGLCQFTNNTYHISESQTNHLYDCFNSDIMGNFIFEVQMKITRGDCGGISFHNGENGVYRYVVCRDGSYFLLYCTSAGYKVLTEGNSSAIYKEINRVNVVAMATENASIELYVNEKSINTICNEQAPFGVTGLIAMDLSTPTEVVYSSAKTWVHGGSSGVTTIIGNPTGGDPTASLGQRCG